MQDLSTLICAKSLQAESVSLLDDMVAFSAKVDNKLNDLLEKEQQLLALSKEVDERLKTIEEKENYFNSMLGRMYRDKSAAESKVSFNVGGRVFTASKDTFLRWDNTYFHALLCNDSWNVDEDGAYFIDRNPTLFDHIMASLRSGIPVDGHGLSPVEVAQLSAEVDYYQLPSKLNYKPMKWDATRCDSAIIVSADGRTATKSSEKNVFFGFATATVPDAPIYSVRLRKLQGGELIGYKVDRRDYYLRQNGTLNGGQRFCPPLKEGDLVTGWLDKEAGTISFGVNDINYGNAYHNVTAVCHGFFFPTIALVRPGASMSFEESCKRGVKRAHDGA